MDMEGESATLREPGADYQVFLSFRGPDTRQGFTDCLYHFLTSAGIRVFKDDTDQPLGAKIEKILDAINGSIICIPIFSKTFAHSKWCLLEIARMVSLKKTIFPIFYDVAPDDVKLRTSLYVDALEAHESNKSYQKELQAVTIDPEDTVEAWRKALVEVASRSGRELKQNGFGEFCMAIASEVLTKLKTKDRIITGPLVTINDQVEAVIELLNVDSPDVRFVGIHGMGGIGKTTLAKLVFNQLSHRFKHCSFIDGVRELSKGEPTILQTKLLNDIIRKFTSISNPDDGAKKIRDVLLNKKVLIVLDDVDHIEQIERLVGNSNWFGLGSRIIITTRNKSIIERERLCKVAQYEMVEMNHYQALQLFSKHAFKDDFPPNNYIDLSKEVVSVVGRLPLALEIIGSHLFGKHKNEWRENIRTLAKIPHRDIEKKLRLSYESLGYRAQQIFLDIACFFNNKDKINAMYMWEACKFHPEVAIEDLISTSLVKIINHEKLWMHDQLQDMGREIVCMENFFDFGKRTRLWEHKEAISMLKRREGTRKVQALCLSEDASSSCMEYEELHFLRNLRFLAWHGMKVHGDLKNVFSKLIWFSWYICPTEFTANSLNLESIVILELSGSRIDENWAGWSKIQVGDHLKVLDLTGCKELTRSPNFSKYRALERLILQDCGKLAEIDGSMRNLKSLKYLNLKGCHSLHSFPEGFCSLECLEIIIMEGEDQEFSLPEEIGHLRSLLVLEIVRVRIHKLPDTIGELEKLERLSLLRCSGMEKLPGSIGSLNSLAQLDLSESDIKELPESIGGLGNLQLLNLYCCKALGGLPDSLENLRSLTELDLSCTTVKSLPDSIGYLSELKVLKIMQTEIEKLPKTIWRMVKLEELHASGCDLLKKVPRKIKKLPCLRILDFSSCPSIYKVPSLSKVSSLQTLLLEGCEKLSQLPKLPESLTTLHVASSSLQRLPGFSKLEKLSSLMLSDKSDRHKSSELEESSLAEFEKLTKLLELELHLSNVKHLPTNFSSFTHLKVLAIACLGIGYQIPHLPSTLSKLRLQYVDVKIQLPSLAHLKDLVWLELEDCNIEDGWESLEIEELHSLASFSINNCNFLKALHHLKLPKSLENLWISNCGLLETIPELSDLQDLQKLVISSCGSLTTLSNLSGLHNLKTLELSEYPHLREIPGLGELGSLQGLSISSCGSLTTLSNLSGLQNLKTLDLSEYPLLSEIPGLGELVSLEILRINSCPSLKRLSNLSKLIKLEELDIDDCQNLPQIDGVNNLSLKVREIPTYIRRT